MVNKQKNKRTQWRKNDMYCE